MSKELSAFEDELLRFGDSIIRMSEQTWANNRRDYVRNYVKAITEQQQPSDFLAMERQKLEFWLRNLRENDWMSVDDCATQIAQGYGTLRYLSGLIAGAEERRVMINERAIHEEYIVEYEETCNQLVSHFCWHYDLNEFDPEMDWIGDVPGSTACINEEYYISMEDIVFMLRNDLSWDEFLEWYDYCADVASLDLHPINLRAWVKGAPRYDAKALERLHELHHEIDELTKEISEGF